MIAKQDPELPDVVEVVVRMLAVGEKSANRQAVSGMHMRADPEHGLGVGDPPARANNIRAGMGARELALELEPLPEPVTHPDRGDETIAFDGGVSRGDGRGPSLRGNNDRDPMQTAVQK